MQNQGIARPSFIMEGLRALDENDAEAAQENDIKQVAGTIYSTGIDTVCPSVLDIQEMTNYARLQLSATLVVFFRAMLENPDVQTRAQKEIDAVVSRGHLPDFSDEKALPYITAVLKETIRWWPVAPIGE